jgi:hypothetical protein
MDERRGVTVWVVVRARLVVRLDMSENLDFTLPMELRKSNSIIKLFWEKIVFLHAQSSMGGLDAQLPNMQAPRTFPSEVMRMCHQDDGFNNSIVSHASQLSKSWNTALKIDLGMSLLNLTGCIPQSKGATRSQTNHLCCQEGGQTCGCNHAIRVILCINY